MNVVVGLTPENGTLDLAAARNLLVVDIGYYLDHDEGVRSLVNETYLSMKK